MKGYCKPAEMDRGGYCCGGDITRQAFDAARGEGHFLDLSYRKSLRILIQKVLCPIQ